MKLSVAYLRRALAKLGAQQDEAHDVELSVVGARLWEANCNPSHVLIVRAEELLGLDLSASQPLAVIGTSAYAKGRRGVIQLPASTDSRQVLGVLLDEFERFGVWEQELDELIISGGLLQDFLDLCARPFGNPLALMDASYAYVMGGRKCALQLRHLPLEHHRWWTSGA